METFSKAVTDCLDEEMILLNEDMEEDGIFTSIKHLITEECECVEFREDTGEDYIMKTEGQKGDDGGDRILIGMGHSHSHHGQDNSAILESIVEQNDNGDDERSNLLTTRKSGICQDIPNLIVFKPKKRRHNPFGKEVYSKDRIARRELISIKSPQHHPVEPAVATNKNPLKLSRWKRRVKRISHNPKNESVSSAKR